ncbi:MAG TPA: hypothetical protein VFL62_11710 [Bradyrhizobium sp.]|uniref:hypothetical protein n=1 Tax=Bradyrhizobium sp. TaxID=376 RepID=UPI002D80B7A2|nr:hypothetical protein [Bradyrhizobium sp.]HET7886883.1 hypothetical protein [Bradyrhizobium sp.]
MTTTSEAPSQTPEIETVTSHKPSRRVSILALSVFALGFNATTAVYTLSPSDFALPDVSRLAELPSQAKAVFAELLPHEKASPLPDPVIVALKDIQSSQQSHASSLQETNSTLQRSAALIERDTTVLIGLRQSLTDEQSDIKKISTQLSTLMAKVDTLQNAIAPEITSSIPKGRARSRLSALSHKKWARPSKPVGPVGPVSVGGAPLTIVPAQSAVMAPSPEG